MIVKTNELPKNILVKLPYSIRIREEIEIDSLPEVYRNLLLQYFSNIENSEKDKVIDCKLKVGKYDIDYITDTKTAVINYISNFFTIRKGTYPFDPEFGTTIYQYLQTRNLHALELVLNNELNDLVNSLKKMFETEISVSNASIKIFDNDPYAIYLININIKINNETVIINIEGK